MNDIKVDSWVWGNETIVWGYSPEHKYTLKIIEPKPGRSGCLSLQYHHEKSETWHVLRGIGWGLFVIDNQVCTRLLKQGDFQNIPTGIIHRLMSVTNDFQVLEPSTPDRHAADPSVVKDVVRLDCVHGRECHVPDSELEKSIVVECRRITEEAIFAVENAQLPKEYNTSLLAKYSFKL